MARLGLVFGLARGRCTSAFLAPVLGAVGAVGGEAPLLAGLLVLSLGPGHGAVLVAAGSSAGAVQTALDRNTRSRGLLVLRQLGGGLVLLGSVYLLCVA